MNRDLSLSVPDNLPDLVQKQKDNLGSWEAVRANKSDLINVIRFLKGTEMSESDLNLIIDLAEEYENNRVEFKRLSDSQTVSNPGQRMVLKEFPNKGYWNEYYRTLCVNYSILSAQMIRESCANIVSHLTTNEESTAICREPVKGAVFGSVQSGKTANMEGVIAMGSDQGFNMFVILAGNLTILKDQTVRRLNRDFMGDNALTIIDVNTFRKDRDKVNPNQKNVIVCLKTPGSLKKLHSIITKDESVRRRLKVIMMDDEGDLATPDSSPDSAKERATINRHVMSIVNCCPLNKPDEPYDRSYEAMNYISYTATPFAVLLNESGNASLYPKDFIISIPPSNRYFGPSQIFGCNQADCEYSGLPIVNDSVGIEERFREYESDPDMTDMCGELLDSICWFVCCTAVLRLNEWKRPVSMLINTNSRTDQHKTVGVKILNYLRDNPDYVEMHCETVYFEQTSKFDLEDLERCYPDYYGCEYAEHRGDIIRYPRYDEIRAIVHEILRQGPMQIPISEGDPVFGSGIHICIEDSAKGVLEETPYSVHTRLLYPEKCDVFAPAFMAIGGNALSRGFTLEGLVSTFFIRPVTQADTLMQMGRWFGYRENYELLPRVWMSTKSREDFEFLSELDADLRNEMAYHNRYNHGPSDFARRILAVPRAIGLKRLTAKNKSKGMEYADLSFSGKRQEFASFIVGEGMLENNYRITEEFLCDLNADTSVDKSSPRPDDQWGNVIRWTNVPLSKVLNDFIRKFRTGLGPEGNVDLELLTKWMDGLDNKDVLKRWTVVLAGQKGGKQFVVDQDTQIGMVVRGKEPDMAPEIVKIKTLWSKSDYFRDIFPNEIGDKSVVDRIRSGDYSNGVSALRLEERQASGKLETPSLFIYCIDGQGKTSPKSKKSDLNLNVDVIAFFVDVPYVVLPGDADRVRIRLNPTE